MVSTGLLVNRPFTVHLRAEIDLEVLGVVKDVEESTTLIKLGDAERGERRSTWSHESSHDSQDE